MANCQLGEEGVKQMASVLSNKKNLLVLDLTNNRCGV